MAPAANDDLAPGAELLGSPVTPSDPMDQPAGIAASARTTATYDEIAPIYYEKWHDRSAIEEHLRRFVGMLRAYNLTALPVVDVGCGPGFDAAYFRGTGLRTIGLDLSPAMMAAGRPEFGGDYVQADMRHLPLAAKIGVIPTDLNHFSVLHQYFQATVLGAEHASGFMPSVHKSSSSLLDIF